MASKHNKNGSVSRLCRIALGGLFVALTGTAARAEPTTYWEAQTKAEAYQKKADQYRELGGGVGYKSGLVRQADSEAAKYSAMADKLGAGPDGEPKAAKVSDEEKIACQPSKPTAMIDCTEEQTNEK